MPLDLLLDDAGTRSTAARDALLAALGEDIAFTDDFQETAAGDYALLTGIPALRQAIRIRLLTRPGEVPHRPDLGVGIQDYLFTLDSQAKRDQLKQRIREQMLRDPRIQDVEACEVDKRVLDSKDVIFVQLRLKVLGSSLPLDPFIFPGNS